MNIVFNPISNTFDKYKNSMISFSGFNQKTDTFDKTPSKSLTHFVRKHRLLPSEADLILEANPDISRYLGDIPHDWINLIIPQNRKEADERIKEELSSFAKKTYSYTTYLNFDCFQEECRELEKSLKEILNTDVHSEFFNEGDAGKVFVLDVNNKKYVLKTFHNPDLYGRQRPGHGMQSETLDAAFISRNVPSSSNRYTVFYLSKYARPEEGDGFILSDYIDAASRGAKNHKLRGFFEPVFSLDTVISNNINGTIYDVGGMKCTYEKYNKEYRRIRRILCDFILRADVNACEAFIKKYANTSTYKKAMEQFEKNLRFFYGTEEINKANKPENQLSEKQYEVVKKLIG